MPTETTAEVNGHSGLAAAAAAAASVPTTGALPATALLQRTLARGDDQVAFKPIVNYLRAKLLPAVSSTERKAHANPVLIAIWKKAGIQPSVAVAIVGVVVAASLRRMLKRQPLLLSNLVGVLYPAYQSIKAVERPEADDDERWLTYWSIYGLFTLLDSIHLRVMQYVKFYYVPKMLILHWLFARNGSLAIYRQVLRPFLVKYGGYGVVHAAVDPSSAHPIALVTENPGPLTKEL
ncbi:TB2/DP1, HVA22 family-domain-containing protein [Geranomyces variabilis]|nr:TB2/DP1, HVA22 family-domain-containing protein [Geranomyces variabilis]KAJ3140309.1 Receptor expression-enhancing protein 5 [Geranomyces variabilis]